MGNDLKTIKMAVNLPTYSAISTFPRGGEV